MASIIFVPAKYSKKIIFPENIIDKLPNRLMLFGSVQFLDQLSDIEKQFEKRGKKVLMIKSKNFLYDGMISERSIAWM
jgi:diphthamide synthase subunit DPH2